MTAEQDKGKVLLVDDEAIVRDSLGEWLEIEGYDVLKADSGESALKILQSEPVDVGIFDIRMPGMDGVTLLKNVMEKYPSIAVIMITAHATVESAVECMRIGAYDYIIKPFPPEKLSHLVHNVMALQNLRKTQIKLQDQVTSANFYLRRAERLMNIGKFVSFQANDLRFFLEQIVSKFPENIEQASSSEIANIVSAVKALRKEAEELQTVMRQIVNITKAMEPELERIELKDVITNSLLLAKRRPEVLAANIKVELAEDIRPISGRMWSLVQVCNNLLYNAVSAVKHGGQITISTGQTSDKVFLQIKDTGRGMKEEELERLFDPFFCGWDECEGVGLGLVVSKGIVESLNGQIEIESKFGEGTSVRILFEPVD